MLRRRLLFVTGKGGVGKSTVAAALGLLASRRGLRTIVAEVSGRGDVPRLLGGAPAAEGAEQQLAPELHCIAIDPQRALEEYLADQLPLRSLAELLAGSRTFGYLAAATPGMRELLTIGKVWELAQPARRAAGALPYDLVIVDAPATGHGVAFLAAPSTFAAVAQVGPVARQGLQIHDTLTDARQTGVLVVCTPEEPAVTEALEVGAALRAQLGIEPVGTIVNAMRPWRLHPGDRGALQAALAASPPAGAAAAIELALAEDTRVRSQRAQLRRLPERLAQLPFLFSAQLGPAQLEALLPALGAVGL